MSQWESAKLCHFLCQNIEFLALTHRISGTKTWRDLFSFDEFITYKPHVQALHRQLPPQYAPVYVSQSSGIETRDSFHVGISSIHIQGKISRLQLMLPLEMTTHLFSLIVLFYHLYLFYLLWNPSSPSPISRNNSEKLKFSKISLSPSTREKYSDSSDRMVQEKQPPWRPSSASSSQVHDR